jgi:apolipoprotein N-acyltransferase
VDPLGRIFASLPADTVDSKAVTVRWMSGTTPFDRVGELPWTAAVLAAAAFATLKRPSRRGPGSKPGAGRH